MSSCIDKTVRELAVETPNATRIFERLKIDYCCGGGRSLTEACVVAGVDVGEVTRLLELAAEAPIDRVNGIPSGSLGELIDYILHKHHTFTRDEMERITALSEKVASKHSVNHPELIDVRALFLKLCEDLRSHMFREEIILFPYIKQMDEAVASGAPIPFAPFGTIGNPIRMMMLEHDTAGDILRELRLITDDFRTPADACISYVTLYRALEEFERDLHQHIHLENNILFPRAVKRETSARSY